MSSVFASVFYLANAGIYLTHENTGLLVDGLFDSHEGFDSLPESVETAIMKKQYPFSQLNTLLFTHTHTDHYSYDKVSGFLKKYPETHTILPENGTIQGLHPVSCRHLLDKGKIVPHNALFLQYAGQNFFFSGDADPVYLNRNIPQETVDLFHSRIHMAFVNPFFFSLTPGRKFLNRLDPDRIYIYHMPLQVPDSMRYHEILDRGLEKYTGKPAQALTEFMCRLQ